MVSFVDTKPGDIIYYFPPGAKYREPSLVEVEVVKTFTEADRLMIKGNKSRILFADTEAFWRKNTISVENTPNYFFYKRGIDKGLAIRTIFRNADRIKFFDLGEFR